MKSTGLCLLGLFVVIVTTAADRARTTMATDDDAPRPVLAEVQPPPPSAQRPPAIEPPPQPRAASATVPAGATVVEIRRPERVTAPARATASSSSSRASVSVRSPEPLRASALDTPEAGSAPAVQEAPRSRSWRRSRSRNRYPGPIPTPADWEAPDGPVRIALQAGHWRAQEAPWELSGLRGGGTSFEGTPEWSVNLEIAELTADMLRDEGYEVDILPAVVPPGYRAHLFIAIHADGALDPNASGFRVAAPRRDATGRAGEIVDLLEDRYAENTGIRLLPTVTRRMQNYYAFNFRRYEHALHPMTIAVILETGFMTSARDRRVIFDAQERAARGIVEAVQAFPVTADPDSQ